MPCYILCVCVPILQLEYTNNTTTPACTIIIPNMPQVDNTKYITQNNFKENLSSMSIASNANNTRTNFMYKVIINTNTPSVSSNPKLGYIMYDMPTTILYGTIVGMKV